MKKPLFTLTRKNQKGQVAIFVALIFQVIFVFFALLVNIGLLVHHKINLQQSTDLAAYYGAMKQAESLNAMAHVNYQIRQSWKLLTWRYRVLGTFGNQRENGAVPGSPPMLPISLTPGGGSGPVLATILNLNQFDTSQCPVGPTSPGANSTETPFFCVGHTGFKYWPDGENGCKITCNLLENAAYTIGGVANTMPQVQAGTALNVYGMLGNANTQLAQTCKDLAGANAKVLAQIILSYQADMMARSKTFTMLASNLSKDASLLKDLDGNDVYKGVDKTLRNNLTEANLTGLAPKINTYNSLSHTDCALSSQDPASKKQAKKEFVKRIEFEFINFFQHSCQWQPTGPQDVNGGTQLFNPGSIFHKSRNHLSDGSPLTKPDNTPVLLTGGVPAKSIKIDDPTILSTAIQQELMTLISNDNERFSVGYEKDPWCPAYFVVQASATPRIPFLPLLEIKLNAVAVAKPFGGSMGPWFGKKWESTDSTSQTGLGFADSGKQTDEMLPANNISGQPPQTLKDNARFFTNFSRFVGDTKGLADPKYLAQYHGALINHLPSNGTGLFGSTPTAEPSPANVLKQPNENPSLDSYLEAYDVSRPNYDPIVGGMTGKDSYLRALELSAIAPNQFDLTYYSIDPDFYNNYYLKLKANYAKLDPSQTDDKFIRPDFGYNKNIYGGQLEFSVRNQIEIVKRTFSSFQTGIPNSTPGSPVKFIDAFPELVKRQSSLLTGWTFKNFTEFDKFPGGDMTLPEDTMTFARCSDKWQDNGGQPEYKIPKDTPSANGQPLPSTPGNCVTGGRVGYSVKLVSPSSLSGQQSLGGTGAAKGLIRNPIPTNYLSF